MTELLSVLPLGVILFAYLVWGFRTLPQERWQFIATLPLAKDADGHWRGVNLTYYGFFSAAAYVIAVVALLTLLGAIAVPVERILALTVAVLLVCVPASRVVAGTLKWEAPAERPAPPRGLRRPRRPLGVRGCPEWEFKVVV